MTQKPRCGADRLGGRLRSSPLERDSPKGICEGFVAKGISAEI
jgi:hypothetical protein